MSVLDFFAPKTAAAPAAPATPPTPAAPPKDAAAGTTTPPAGTPVNPLDAYTKMYETANRESGIEAPSFKLDPEVLTKVSGSMDFTRGVDANLMEKALGGDVKSLLEVIQAVGRNSYSSSLEHATALTSTHLGQRAAFDKQNVDKGVRTQLTTNALSDIPNYAHPVVKAQLNAAADLYARANPDANPRQVAEAAKQSLIELAAALNPAVAAEAADGKQEMDWNKYLSS